MHDDWAQWAGNAKYLFYHGKTDYTYFKETNLSSYPLFIMIHEIVLCRVYGNWSDFLCKSFLTILLIDFLGYFYCYVRRQSQRLIALFSALLVVMIPFYIRVGISGTAEIPMSICMALSVMQIHRYLESKNIEDIIFASIFAGIVAVTKSEGAYALVSIFSVFAFVLWKNGMFDLRHFLLCLGIMLVFIVPWNLMKYLNGYTDSRMVGFTLKWMFDLKSFLDILKMSITFLVPSKSLLLTGPYFIAALFYWIILNREDLFTFYVLLMMFGISGIYAFGCYSTNWSTQYGRLLTHLIGLMLLVIIRQTSTFHRQFCRVKN